MEEIFRMIRERLDDLNLSRPLGGGVVLTGGGALLSGVVELATRVLKLPARVGSPIPSQGLGGLVQEYRSPVYATAIGLVLEGNDRETREGPERAADKPVEKAQSDLFAKIGSWLREFF
jgi:cell division protein FtsA